MPKPYQKTITVNKKDYLKAEEDAKAQNMKTATYVTALIRRGNRKRKC